MKKKLITMLGSVLLTIGLVSAQYCPPSTVSGGAGYRSSSLYNSNVYRALDNFTITFSNTLDKGVRSGYLTQHEFWVLENGYDRFARRVQRAYIDGRMTRSEWSMIQFSMRNLQRDLEREWNDGQIRTG